MSVVKPLRYLQNERIWLLSTTPEVEWEIVVGGDSSAPSRAGVALVEQVLPQIDRLVAQATRYLDEFVDRSRFAQGHEWFFVGLETGRHAAEPVRQFQLSFTNEGDIYGYWSVTFTETGRGLYPVRLSRRQY